MISPTSRKSFNPKTSISVYKWFPCSNYLLNTYQSKVRQSWLAFSDGLKNTLFHAFLSLEIFLLTFMKSLGVRTAKVLGYEFSHVGYNCSQVHLAGRVHSAFLFTSVFQFIHVNKLLVTYVTKIPPARGKWRHTWMKFCAGLASTFRIPGVSFTKVYGSSHLGRTLGPLEVNKWRFSLILVYISARENEWDGGYNRNWSDLNIFPILFYKCLQAAHFI